MPPAGIRRRAGRGDAMIEAPHGKPIPLLINPRQAQGLTAPERYRGSASEKCQGHTYLQPLSCSRTDCQDPSLSALARHQTRQDRHDCFDSIAGYSIPDHSYEAHCMTRKLLCERRRMYEQKIYPLKLAGNGRTMARANLQWREQILEGRRIDETSEVGDV